MLVKIYKPTKTAMQSGKKNTKMWVIKFEHDNTKRVEPIMGWTSSSDMSQQLCLKFDTKDAAIRFAKENNMMYEIIEPEKPKIIKKSYASNFL